MDVNGCFTEIPGRKRERGVAICIDSGINEPYSYVSLSRSCRRFLWSCSAMRLRAVLNDSRVQDYLPTRLRPLRMPDGCRGTRNVRNRDQIHAEALHGRYFIASVRLTEPNACPAALPLFSLGILFLLHVGTETTHRRIPANTSLGA
jgi:hypothetical protein